MCSKEKFSSLHLFFQWKATGNLQLSLVFGLGIVHQHYEYDRACSEEITHCSVDRVY